MDREYEGNWIERERRAALQERVTSWVFLGLLALSMLWWCLHD